MVPRCAPTAVSPQRHRPRRLALKLLAQVGGLCSQVKRRSLDLRILARLELQPLCRRRMQEAVSCACLRLLLQGRRELLVLVEHQRDRVLLITASRAWRKAALCAKKYSPT